MALRKIKVDSLIGSPVSVYFNSEYSEYIVKIKGNSAADYFTDDKQDALQTARHMLKSFLSADI